MRFKLTFLFNVLAVLCGGWSVLLMDFLPLEAICLAFLSGVMVTSASKIVDAKNDHARDITFVKENGINNPKKVEDR
jgi:Kef-type K+ transport system membrane component KefB